MLITRKLTTLNIFSVNMILLAILAAAFALGRSFHAYGFAFTAGNVFLRVRGMQLTFFTILILALLNIAMLVYGWISAGVS